MLVVCGRGVDRVPLRRPAAGVPLYEASDVAVRSTVFLEPAAFPALLCDSEQSKTGPAGAKIGAKGGVDARVRAERIGASIYFSCP